MFTLCPIHAQCNYFHLNYSPSQLKLCPDNLFTKQCFGLAKKHSPKSSVLFTVPRAATKTAVISQGTYFSDICQVLGTFYAFTKK